jgi:hypothetical protein
MKLEHEAQERADVSSRQTASAQRQYAGKRDMAVGGVFLVGGLGFTAFDFLMTASQGGGDFLIATGAIAFGGYRLIRGAIRCMTA